jgi:glutathione S-transferase
MRCTHRVYANYALGASSAGHYGESMQLYFAPLACSMATRISLNEAGKEAEFVEVDQKTKKTMKGDDYLAINPLGLVPALRTDDGEVVYENAAILQYVAARFPEAKLAPEDAFGKTRLQQWLCFIGTELHKALFVPVLDSKAPEGARTYAMDKGLSRLDFLNTYLEGRDFLLGSFSVADAYLITVLTWSVATPIDLAKWPAIDAYVNRLRQRPSVARALAVEFPLYQAEVRRKAS